MLKSVADSYDLWLFAPKEPDWESRYLRGNTVVDTLDPREAMESAVRLAESVQIAGVLCYDEIRVPIAAIVAETLKLPCANVEGVRACRDKHLGREALAAAGVEQPASRAVASLEEAQEAARTTGFPVVLKPRALAASVGVVRADGPEAVEAAYSEASEAYFDEIPRDHAWVLVEEYLDGPEVSVESVCRDGRVTPMFVARKALGFAPHFEEVGHTVSADDPLLDDPAVRHVLQEAHTALGLGTLVTHTELRLTRNGPSLVEVNARLGGDLIPYVARLATGVDYGKVAADLAAGAEPDVTPVRTASAHIQFLYPEHDLDVTSLTVEDELPPGVHEVRLMVEPGRRLRLPPRDHVAGRYAYVVTTGASPEECAEALRAATPLIHLAGTPTG
ncbi:MAG TPA: ATP-grasp domain-containing protein [Streptomyces sp.]|uniref:ATP-grasp domain-containing protein n=1 Tax=Streptomyces sp. TaxID=1931 RepID=UPI002BEE7FE7|nr:ATP-grasp domain-containing protein [Streptomyces sp.]HWU05266.1 ATP-grasp domain-containing protein [Streptomyces sp.]